MSSKRKHDVAKNFEWPCTALENKTSIPKSSWTPLPVRIVRQVQVLQAPRLQLLNRLRRPLLQHLWQLVPLFRRQLQELPNLIHLIRDLIDVRRKARWQLFSPRPAHHGARLLPHHVRNRLVHRQRLVVDWILVHLASEQRRMKYLLLLS